MEQSSREQLLVFWSTPFYVIIILSEIFLSNYNHKKNYTIYDTATNFILMLLNGVIDLAFRGIYVFILFFFWQHRIIQIENIWVYWIFLLVAEDFLFYWLHRFDHDIRLFWAIHVTHHSSEKFNLSVGFRSSVFQPLYRFIYFIPLAFLGFKPLDIVFMYSATQIWGILVHTEFIGKLGWLEFILVTPSHHRVHHASNPKYLDKNMGFFLIIWDKMFGTFQKELSENNYQSIKFGLTTPFKKQSTVHIIFHEWISIFKDVSKKELNWKQRFNYVFGPPGWSHDGSRKTSKELRKDEHLNIF